MTAPVSSPAEFRRRQGLDVLAWPLFDGQAVEAMVTTRTGGVSAGPYASLNLGLHVGDSTSAVLENRRRAAAAFDADLADLVFCNQAHGRQVHVVAATDRGRGTLSLDDAIQETDALVTTSPEVVLVVLVADCVPIVLYDPQAQILACVHAGWRGTVARVTEAAVQTMSSLGASPDRLLAGLGPAISPDAYQVGPEVADAAHHCFGGDAGPIITPDGSGRWLFDLWTANKRILTEAGVQEENIQVAMLSTGGPGSSFFSDRDARPCGRFAVMARITAQATG